MNPVFWLLVIIFAIILWFIISPLFNFIGKSLINKLSKTGEILNKEINEEEEKET